MINFSAIFSKLLPSYLRPTPVRVDLSQRLVRALPIAHGGVGLGLNNHVTLNLFPPQRRCWVPLKLTKNARPSIEVKQAGANVIRIFQATNDSSAQWHRIPAEWGLNHGDSFTLSQPKQYRNAFKLTIYDKTGQVVESLLVVRHKLGVVVETHVSRFFFSLKGRLDATRSKLL